MNATQHEAARRRVIGRILALGFPMPGVRVDNYNFCSAPSFFDYDALVVDPSALSRLIEGVVDGSLEARTFSDRAVRDEPASPDDVALAGLLARRRDETRWLLERGGVIACFAHPATVHRGIRGVDELDDYYWLGESRSAAVAGEGTRAEICDDQHPMAPFVRAQLENISYRAHLADAVSVFARSYGGAAIGGDIASKNGRIVMLPALKALPSGEARYAMSESLQSGVRRMLGVMAEGRAPGWVARYALPAQEEEGEDLAKYQRLLWQEGILGLEDVALEALRLIGFDVYGSNAEALELRAGGTPVLLEIDASDGAIGLAPHYRLRQRIERAIERGGAAPRGLIFINGHRLVDPAARPAQASGPLRTAAETMGYAVATTSGLFDSVVAKLSGDQAGVERYRHALTIGSGLISDTAQP